MRLLTPVFMLTALFILMGTTASAQSEPLAVYPPMAPCDGEVFSFWFEGDSYIPGYQACDIIGAVDLGNYQATCPDGLLFSAVMGGCIFSLDEGPIGGINDPEPITSELIRHDMVFLFIGNTGGVGANCRAGASTEYEIVTVLPEGTPVAVDAYQGNWSRLAFEGGTSCFVAGEYLTDVQPVVEANPINDGDTDLPIEIDVPVDNLPGTKDIGDGTDNSVDDVDVTTLPNTGRSYVEQDLENEESQPTLTPRQRQGALLIAVICGIALVIARPWRSPHSRK